MNRYILFAAFLVISINGCKQKDTEAEVPVSGNSLLWKISGNGLEKPSYLYGTMHIICKEDASLSEYFISIIKRTDAIYFEVDMENTSMDEMIELLEEMKMNGDTTLGDLLSEDDLTNVKDYLEEANVIMPYSELESYHPIMVYTILSEAISECEESTGIEEEITKQAKKYKKKMFGIETMDYQVRMMDSIPYKEQAKELVEYIDSLRRPDGIKIEKEKMRTLSNVYTSQDLDSLNKMIVEVDPAFMASFADLLLYNRNRNWVTELKKLMKQSSLVLAVGAGHLPGERGVINLLRKEGYEVTAIKNDLPLKKKKD